MNKLTATTFALLVCAAAPLPGSAQETDAQCKVRLFTTTKLVAVTDVVFDKFVHDNDANTLELVYLSSGQDRQSGVSDDAQAVFLNHASSGEMTKLTDQAIDKRMQLGFCKRNAPPK